MVVSVINHVRRDQTLADLDALRSAIEAWLKTREDLDRDEQRIYVGRHKTQLQTLKTTLLAAADGLETAANGLDVKAEPGALYDGCRDVDLAVVWLQRLWEFYRDKFDQRDAPPPLGRIVHAADEVVWSCYHEVMERAAQRDENVRHGAAPLAYIAPEYSPAALDSESPLTGSLKLDVDFASWGEKERALVETLPVPLLRLPPWCVQSPWWLVHIAHEIGHEVYTALNLTSHVREGVKAAARTVLNDAESDRWRNWSEEIFADVFSVLMMGTAAVRGVTEVERATTARMVRPTQKYPAPAVRLELIAETARRLGGVPDDWLAGIKPRAIASTDTAAERHMGAVSPVVTFLLDSTLPGSLGTLRDLCDANPNRWPDHVGNVASWVPQVSVGVDSAFAGDITTARYVCAASVAAWHELTTKDNDETRKKNLVQLASASSSILMKSGPPGTRAAAQPDADESPRGHDLCTALLKNARRTRENTEGTHGIQN